MQFDKMLYGVALAAIVAGCAQGPLPARQIAISANETKAYNDNGVAKVYNPPAGDSVTILNLAVNPPAVVATVPAPVSVVGPPTSVAIAPDLSFAVVSAAGRINPANPNEVIDGKTLSVIDLEAAPPRVVQTVEAGLGVAGVAIVPAGNLLLAANRSEGTVSVFSITGKSLSPVGKVSLGDAKSGPSGIAITPDGKRALVTRDGDNVLSLLSIDGNKVASAGRDFYAGLRPYGVDMAPDGSFAAVANIGRGQGDADTVSIIDMKANPPRTVDTITVGATPEGIKISPDGKFIGVVVHNGSPRPPSSPLYNPNGFLVMLKVDGMKLSRVAEGKIGRWSQGIVFNASGNSVLVQNMVERNIQVFSFDGRTLVDTGRPIAIPGGGAAMAAGYR